MSALFEMFLSENQYFSQVFNCEKSVKNTSLENIKKKQDKF